MQVDMTQTFFNANGEVVIDARTEKPSTLRDALSQLVLHPEAPNEEKLKRFELFKRFRDYGLCMLSPDEMDFLKQHALLTFPTLVAGQITDMLTLPSPGFELAKFQRDRADVAVENKDLVRQFLHDNTRPKHDPDSHRNVTNI